MRIRAFFARAARRPLMTGALVLALADLGWTPLGPSDLSFALPMRIRAFFARAARRPLMTGALVLALADLGWTLILLPGLMSARQHGVDDLPAAGLRR